MAEMSARGRWRGVAVLVLVVGGGSQVGAACTSCEQPYRAVGVQSDDPYDEEPPYVDWPVTGTARAPVADGLDSDGDGATDAVEPTGSGDPLVVHRGSGRLVLAAPTGATVAYTDETLVQAGDLDGDGRDEILVSTFVVTPDGGSTGPYVDYVVPGDTPDGTHTLDRVGAAPFGADADGGLLLRPAGDVDADGRDDLAVERYDDAGTQEVHVWSGAGLVLTPGSGGAGTTPPPPDHVVAGRLFSPVPLEGRDALLVVTLFGATEQRVSLWSPGGAVTFTTEGTGVAGTVPALGGPAEVVEDGDEAWLTATFSYRSGTQAWAWDLDDLCADAPEALEPALG